MAKPSGHPVEQTRVLAVQLKGEAENTEEHVDAKERASDSEDDTVDWKCKCCSEEASDESRNESLRESLSHPSKAINPSTWESSPGFATIFGDHHRREAILATHSAASYVRAL